MLLQRRRTTTAARHEAQRANPLYGYGYFPNWPSILSVAHDEANGGRVFIITDRPCVLVNPPTGLPLSLAGLDVLWAQAILPVKFRLWMNGPVPPGSPWVWASGGSGIVDAITGNMLNPAGGSCADLPGPYAPLPGVLVVAVAASGDTATLTFDRPVVLTGDPPDDAITFGGQIASAVVNVDGTTLSFTLPGLITPGDEWIISRQPAWIVNEVGVPQSGGL
jgi:hypothetical protein